MLLLLICKELRSMRKTKIGVIGGGQLAWMMAKVADSLAIELVIQTASKQDPAVSLAKDCIIAPIDDAEATARLASICDLITFENEFVDLQALQKLAHQGVSFYPSLESLSPLLDKYHQRCCLSKIGLPVPKFIDLKPNLETTSSLTTQQDPETRPTNYYSQLSELLNQHKLTFPLVLKTRRHGYDGQGTVIVKTEPELQLTLKNFNKVDLLAEEFIDFECELAVIAARNTKGEIRIYPTVKTYQKNQVCHWVIAPFDLPPKQDQIIKQLASELLTKLNYVGVLGIELFLTKSGAILVNEVAPRTHNSGHYSLDACNISQFAMQLKAITGKPLGNIHLKTDGAVMVNLLGYENSKSDYLPQRKAIANLNNSYLHWYSKTESRVGRKLGHVTVLLDIHKGENLSNKGKLIAEQIESIWYQ